VPIASKQKQRINEDITAPKVRLIDQEGEQKGIVSRDEALAAADGAELDLVEISPNADPPVCRIMDFGKFLYEDSKRKAAARKNQKQIQVKEIKFRPGTDVGDYAIKLRKLTDFLQNGDKTKVKWWWFWDRRSKLLNFSWLSIMANERLAPLWS